MTHYDSIMRATESVVEILRAAGMTEDHLSEVKERLTFMAGAYLPPVGATLNLRLEQTEVRT